MYHRRFSIEYIKAFEMKRKTGADAHMSIIITATTAETTTTIKIKKEEESNKKQGHGGKNCLAYVSA